MAFSANPLALSVPDPALMSWLRDNGYQKILDKRQSDLLRLSPTTTTTTTSSNSATAHPPSVATAVATGFFLSNVLNHIGILLSILTINPFSKLTNEDFSGNTPPWTLGFIGYSDSYSFPSFRSQARMRVMENNKRYFRNYFTLFIVFFACSLYQLPIALVGLVSSLALWDLFAYCVKRWGLDNHPVTRECMLRVVQCGTAVIIFVCSVQTAVLYALGVSYAVMMLHASSRKLTPMKHRDVGLVAVPVSGTCWGRKRAGDGPKRFGCVSDLAGVVSAKFRAAFPIFLGFKVKVGFYILLSANPLQRHASWVKTNPRIAPL